MADVKRRPYRTSIRRGDAPALICEAAHRLFSSKGYLATSITDIAAEAGVARPTVFSAVGPKATILRLVVDRALAGDDAPVPIAQRPWWREAIEERDPVRSIELAARNMCLINQRSAAVLRALETAASVDAEASEVWDRFQRQRRDGLNEFALALTHKADNAALRRRHHHRHPLDAHTRRLPTTRRRRRLATRTVSGLAHRRLLTPLPHLNSHKGEVQDPAHDAQGEVAPTVGHLRMGVLGPAVIRSGPNCDSVGMNERSAGDAELLARVGLGVGDEAALREPFERHAAWRMLRLHRRTADEDVAAEAVQDTFEAVWRWAPRCGGSRAGMLRVTIGVRHGSQGLPLTMIPSSLSIECTQVHFGLRLTTRENREMSTSSHKSVISTYAQAPARTVTVGGFTSPTEGWARRADPGRVLRAPGRDLGQLGPPHRRRDREAPHVITFDQRGVGASSGEVPATIEAAADHAYEFITALGFDTIDAFTFSMGGMIAQDLIVKHPHLVRRLVLTGTGPRGGKDIDKVVGVTYWDILRATLTRSDPRSSCSSTATPPASPPRRPSSSAARTNRRP